MVLVGELRPEPQRATVGIDLVVGGQQVAAGDFLGLLPIVSVHRQVHSGSELFEQRR